MESELIRRARSLATPIDQDTLAQKWILESELIRKARGLASRIDVNGLAQNGIKRDRTKYFLNIVYPSFQAMSPMGAEEVYGRNYAVETLVPEKPLKVALYVHIPFCTGKCFYCHYYTLALQQERTVSAYLEALPKEMALYKRLLGGGEKIKAASVYVGGGTPTTLSDAQLSRLFEDLHENFEFSNDVEISMETHPSSTTREKLLLLKGLGVNRLSMGIESFDDEMLKRIYRRHSSQQAVDAFHLMREVGFKSVNLDLIYGMPTETLESWEFNLNKMFELSPDSFSAYFYRLKEGTGLHFIHGQQPELFPSNEDMLLMHIMTMEKAREQGYEQKLSDWYVKGEEHYHQYQDHNWGKGETVPLLGTGVSAYSYVHDTQYYNYNNIVKYMTYLNEGKLPIAKGLKLDFEEKMRRMMFLGIKTRVDKAYFKKVFGVALDDAFPVEIRKLEKLGLIKNTEREVRLTYLGNLFADEVGQEFYSKKVKEKMSTVRPTLISTTSQHLNPV